MSRTWTKDELVAAHALLELAAGGDRANLQAFIRHLSDTSMTAFPPTRANRAIGRFAKNGQAIRSEKPQVLYDHAVTATEILVIGRLLREHGLQVVLIAFDLVVGVRDTLDREGTVRKVAELLDGVYGRG